MPSIVTGFVRHGRYEQPPGMPSALLPHGLTDEGRRESEAGAKAIVQLVEQRNLTLDPVIDSSPLRRAWETAEIMAEHLRGALGTSVSVECFDDLCERSLGNMANLTVDQIARVVEDDPRYAPLPANWKRSPDFRLPGVGTESPLDAGQRVREHVVRRAKPEGSKLTLKLFVGHGGAFRHAAYHLGLLGLDEIERLSMFYAGSVFFLRDGNEWSRFAGSWKERRPKTKEAID